MEEVTFKRPQLHSKAIGTPFLMFPRLRQLPWYIAHSGVPEYNLGDSFMYHLPR